MEVVYRDPPRRDVWRQCFKRSGVVQRDVGLGPLATAIPFRHRGGGLEDELGPRTRGLEFVKDGREVRLVLLDRHLLRVVVKIVQPEVDVDQVPLKN